MGADLYMKGHDNYREKMQPLVDVAVANRDHLKATGATALEVEAAQRVVEDAYNRLLPDEYYFRDSYNNSSVLWRLGLSWWQDFSEYYLPEDQQTDEVNVGPEGCRLFAERVEQTELKLWTEEEFIEKGWALADLKEANEYLTLKKEKLIRFLRTAANEGGIYASC